MLSIILSLLIAWTFYGTAKRLGRNGILWSIVTVAAFWIVQTAAIYVSVFTIGLLNQLFNQNIAWDFFGGTVMILGIIVGLVAVGFVSVYLHRVAKVEYFQKPPLPPEFD
jgi:cellobiose-specific phosphotransferase system component IIC